MMRFFLGWTFTLLTIPLWSQKLQITVNVYNFPNNKGWARMALFHPKDQFLSNSPFQNCQVIVKESKAQCVFNVPVGQYAIAILHDADNNKKMSKNILGIPTEAYGFSGQNRPKFRAPSFKDAMITIEKPTEITIRLEKF